MVIDARSSAVGAGAGAVAAGAGDAAARSATGRAAGAAGAMGAAHPHVQAIHPIRTNRSRTTGPSTTRARWGAKWAAGALASPASGSPTRAAPRAG